MNFVRRRYTDERTRYEKHLRTKPTLKIKVPDPFDKSRGIKIINLINCTYKYMINLQDSSIS